MRGGRTAWYAPLGILFFTFLFAACKLNLNLAEPYLELQINSNYRIYNPQPPLPDDYIQYTFFADEPVLRCRYMLSRNGQFLLSGETEPQTAGVWYNLPLNISELVEGKYQLDLVVQAERSREFVDLAFLKKSAIFFMDFQPPEPPGVDLPNEQRFTQQKSVKFIHPEWPETSGSPVMVYCTTDGTDPNPDDPNDLYNGSSLALPFESSTVTLRAIAVDAAGNKSLEMSPKEYRFMHISSINPTSSSLIYLDIEVIGFGFSPVTKAGLSMKDKDGTDVFIPYSPNVTDTSVTFSAHLDYEGIDAGPATITPSYNDPGLVEDTVTFEIK